MAPEAILLPITYAPNTTSFPVNIYIALVGYFGRLFTHTVEWYSVFTQHYLWYLAGIKSRDKNKPAHGAHANWCSWKVPTFPPSPHPSTPIKSK